MNTEFFGDFDEELQIDLTPLIDCLFILIIFFVLTMSFSKPVLEVILPESSEAAAPHERNDILVSVKANGSLYLDGDLTTPEALASALDAQPDRLLNIYMDEKAPFASFVRVMDVAKAKRAGRFVISTRAEGEAAPSASSSSSSSAASSPEAR